LILDRLTDNAPVWKAYHNEAQVHGRWLEWGHGCTSGVCEHFEICICTLVIDIKHSLGWSFSAILTAFTIEFYKQLQPDSAGMSASLLLNLAVTLQCVANGTTYTDLPAVPSTKFQASENARWINGLWFTSLSLCLSVLAVAIFVKQWGQTYSPGLTGLPKTYTQTHQFYYNGIERWHMSTIIGILPTVMYSSIFLFFFIGSLVLLWTLDPRISKVCLTIVVLAAAGYAVKTVLPVIYLNCPFELQLLDLLRLLSHI
jgi:hypothetical protein